MAFWVFIFKNIYCILKLFLNRIKESKFFLAERFELPIVCSLASVRELECLIKIIIIITCKFIYFDLETDNLNAQNI